MTNSFGSNPLGHRQSLLLLFFPSASRRQTALGPATADTRQPTFDCGSLALSSFILAHRHDVSLQQIEGVLPRPTPSGRSLEDLVKAASLIGVRLKAVRYARSSPIREPAILHLDRAGHGHFVFV